MLLGRTAVNSFRALVRKLPQCLWWSRQIRLRVWVRRGSGTAHGETVPTDCCILPVLTSNPACPSSEVVLNCLSSPSYGIMLGPSRKQLEGRPRNEGDKHTVFTSRMNLLCFRNLMQSTKRWTKQVRLHLILLSKVTVLFNIQKSSC